MVRRGLSEPVKVYDDVMTIYVEAGIVRADYFDSEGHVILYVAQAREGEVRLSSEIKLSEPRYRLTYTKESATTVKGTFEIAPPVVPLAPAACVPAATERSRMQVLYSHRP